MKGRSIACIRSARIGEAPKAYLLTSAPSRREVIVIVCSRRCCIGALTNVFGVLGYLSHRASAGAEVRNLSTKSVRERISPWAGSPAQLETVKPLEKARMKAVR